MKQLRRSCVGLMVALLGACVPVPQRVKEEFSAPDDKRPNNFVIRSSRAAATAADDDAVDGAGASVEHVSPAVDQKQGQ